MTRSCREHLSADLVLRQEPEDEEEDEEDDGGEKDDDGDEGYSIKGFRVGVMRSISNVHSAEHARLSAHSTGDSAPSSPRQNACEAAPVDRAH
jgi:hypothetical protein